MALLLALFAAFFYGMYWTVKYLAIGLFYLAVGVVWLVTQAAEQIQRHRAAR